MAFGFVLDALALSQPVRFAFKHHTMFIVTHLLLLLQYPFISSDLGWRAGALSCAEPWNGMAADRTGFLSEGLKQTLALTPLSARRNCLIHWAAQSQTRGTTLKKSFVHYLALRISERITFHL